MSHNKIIGTDIILEFLEVALHSILYYRKLYPEEIFIKRKIYGIPVNVSQHLELNEYITNILTCAKTLLQEDKNNLNSINILFFNENKVPVEKFTFQIDRLQTNIPEIDPYFMQTEEALKTLCLKLSTLERYLEPLTNNSSFIINVITNYAAFIALTENLKCQDFPWIADDNYKEVREVGQLLPVKSFTTDYLVLQCYTVEYKQLRVADK